MWFDLFLRKLGDLFLSKVVDKTTDKALDGLNNFNGFELTLETLQKNLKSLSAKASDVEEVIKAAELSGRKKRKREVEEWLAAVKSFEQEVDEMGGSQVDREGFIKRLMEGGKAAQLDKQVKELAEQSRYFGELVLDVCGTSGEAFLTRGLVGQAFGENVEKILRLLESGEVSSIGLHGMGGVGKTTLAKHINNRLKQDPERRVYWVAVSQEFTVAGLQDKIARLLGLDLLDEDEEGKRAMRLQTALSQQKSSVLILDDVWDNIDLFQVGCLCSPDGCKLIITTRSVGVCHQIRCQKEILVEKLDEGEAWRLFHESLGNEIELDPEVEGIAKSMVKLCGGLPLGIIMVARSMRGKIGCYRWENALQELKDLVKGHDDGMDEDEVFEVLKFSFDRLKEKNDKSNDEFNMIQLCFLYCSLYPKDYQIKRDDLVRKFISGGLLDERRSRIKQAELGHCILDELVDARLLEGCVDSWNRECVKMHNLVRSMALKICKGKYLVRAGEMSLMEIPNEDEWTEDLKNVSLMKCQIRIIKQGISPDCPELSTLLLSGNHWLSAISNSFFYKMQGLCTLDLGETNVRILPNSVCDLTCLKALVLENCTDLIYVPNLGKLKALRELDLSGTAIKEVPQGLDQLLKLEFLSLMDAHKLMKLPSGLLLKLVHLQKVSTPFHLEAPIEDIQNLRLLEDFSGSMRLVEDFNRLMKSGESRQELLTWYAIIIGEHDKAKVCQFEPSSYKRKLDLCGCNLEGATVLGQDTEYLVISGCEGLSISFLDGFPVLRRLRVEFCRGIDCILRSAQESQFSNTLEEIQLVFLADLKGVVMQRGGIGASASATQPAVFSSLKQLQIRSCNKMRKVGLPVWGLPKLELISIVECAEIEEIFEDEGIDSVTTLPELSQLRLHGLPRLRKLGLPVSGVPNLEVLSIEWCKEIEEIFEDEGIDSVTTLPELSQLSLHGLPRLRKLGLPVSGVPNLEVLSIEWCAEIEEIFEDEGIDSVTTLLELSQLSLHELPRLRKEGRAGPIVITLPKFKKLHLEGLPILRNVSKATMLCNSVENIHIEECPRLMNKLPLHMDVAPPPFLRNITVKREWWESLEWDNPDLPQLLQPFLRL